MIRKKHSRNDECEGSNQLLRTETHRPRQSFFDDLEEEKIPRHHKQSVKSKIAPSKEEVDDFYTTALEERIEKYKEVKKSAKAVKKELTDYVEEEVQRVADLCRAMFFSLDDYDEFIVTADKLKETIQRQTDKTQKSIDVHKRELGETDQLKVLKRRKKQLKEEQPSVDKKLS